MICLAEHDGEMARAVALAPQHRDNSVVYLPVCGGHLYGWTDESEPEYGATSYRAYYLDTENIVPEHIMLGIEG